MNKIKFYIVLITIFTGSILLADEVNLSETEDLFSSRIYFMSSLSIMGLSCIRTTRSRVFSSSLTFPGQSYWLRVCIASYDKQFTEILCFFFKLFKIDIVVGKTSSFLSLRGGTVIGKTFIR